MADYQVIIETQDQDHRTVDAGDSVVASRVSWGVKLWFGFGCIDAARPDATVAVRVDHRDREKLTLD